ncbi:MAG TPA: hypothetical protein VFO70_09060 [Chitinophagaceae bacterium]|nr:hypothetical protein [Chitinophagaceae bacterium]
METNLHKENNEMEDRLWNYIDGTLNTAEKTTIEQLLEADSSWKEKYRELLEINQLLKSSELEVPSLRFGKNVMEEIAKLQIAPATGSYINNKIIWGIGIFFVTLIIGFLVYGFGQIDWTAGESSTISNQLGKVDFNKFFNNDWVNAFMMINVVLALFLLDNILRNKMKQAKSKM